MQCVFLWHAVCDTKSLHGETVSQANQAHIDLAHLTQLWHLHSALPSGVVFLFFFFLNTSSWEDLFFFFLTKVCILVGGVLVVVVSQCLQL